MTTKKYDHWCVRVKDLRGQITTASFPGAMKKELVAKAGGEEALIALTKRVAKALRKQPGGPTLSAQVRERVQTVLARRERETVYKSKNNEGLSWPESVDADGVLK